MKSSPSGNAFMQCPQCKAFYERHISFCTSDGTKLEETNSESLSNKAEPLFAGKYEILDEIGSGGMGTVYRVRQTFLDKVCALKVIPAESLNDVLITRFQQEAKTMASLDHDNLGRILDFGISNNQPFMVMEYLDGSPLNKLIAQNSLSIEDTVDIFGQVLNALSHAHKKGVLHRDIKPSNIMIMRHVVTPSGNSGAFKAILLDFGIAKKIDDNDLNSSKAQALTRTGEMIGSPLYMSPEQARGEKLTERSDLYSLGCALFECLTGTVPFVGNSTVDILISHMEKPLPTLKEASLGKDFPVGLERVVRKLLNKDPAERYQNADETRHALSLSLTLADADVDKQAGSNTKTVSRPGMILAAISLLAIVWLIAFQSMQSGNNTSATTHISAPDDKLGIVKTLKTVADVRFLNDPKDSQRSAEVESTDVQFKQPTEKLSEYIPVTGKEFELALHGQELDDAQVELIEQNKNLVRLGLANAEFPHRMLGSLSASLKVLRISETGTRDEDMKYVAKNRNLEKLMLNSNPISSNGIAHLSALKSLTYLDIASTQCDAAGIHALRNLPKLTSLYLSNSNHIDDKAAEAVATLPAVKLLTVNNTKVRGKGIAHLSRIPTLSYLFLNELNLTDNEISSLRNFPRLATIHLCDNRLTSAGVKHLLGAKKLVKVELENNPIDDKAIDTLLRMPKLHYLNLSGTKITRAGLMRLAALPKLRDIYVRRIAGVTEADAHDFLTNCKSCREFVFLKNRDSGYRRSEWLLDEKTKAEQHKFAHPGE